MKRLLAGAAALATAFVLAACSGGGSAGGANAGGGAVAAGTGGGTPTTSSTTPTPTATVTVPTPTATPTPSSSTKPAPTSTSAKPKPKPTPTPKPTPKPAPDPGVPCAAAAAASGTAACVDLSAHKAWLLDGGKVVYGPVPMLPGRKGNETPTGTFHVLSKEKMHLSKEFDNAEMPNSVFFYPGDAFHTGSLSVYSHGCIHLSAGASLKFFNTLHLGDIVQVVP